jgi:ketosteroid isomerase-like protein
VRAAVQRYLAAVAHGDAAGACAQLTDRSRQELADVGAQLRIVHRSCEATLTRAFNSPSGPAMRRLGRLRIARVTVKGDKAVAVFSGGGRPILLVHDGDAWRIESTPAGGRD